VAWSPQQPIVAGPDVPPPGAPGPATTCADATQKSDYAAGVAVRRPPPAALSLCESLGPAPQQGLFDRRPASGCASRSGFPAFVITHDQVPLAVDRGLHARPGHDLHIDRRELSRRLAADTRRYVGRSEHRRGAGPTRRRPSGPDRDDGLTGGRRNTLPPGRHRLRSRRPDPRATQPPRSSRALLGEVYEAGFEGVLAFRAVACRYVSSVPMRTIRYMTFTRAHVDNLRAKGSQGTLTVMMANELVSAYRIVKSVHRSDPVMLDVFRSNYEREARPRGLEVESALIHFGLSMYLVREMAVATARRCPRLGRHIAEMRLEPGHGFCWAHTAQPGHVTVWGRPYNCSLA